MIYLDYQATTPLAPEAREAMLKHMDGPGGTGFGNPHSSHRLGRQAAAAIEAAREHVPPRVDPPIVSSHCVFQWCCGFRRPECASNSSTGDTHERDKIRQARCDKLRVPRDLGTATTVVELRTASVLEKYARRIVCCVATMRRSAEIRTFHSAPHLRDAYVS